MTCAANKPRVLLATGGTGGHLFPAEALARQLLPRGCAIDLATDARGRGIDGGAFQVGLHRISAGGLAGKSAFQRLIGVMRLGWGLVQSLRLIWREQPGCVVGFGGYASVPVVLAAQWMGKPTLIHEQNAVIGRANRFLMRRARLVATSFKATRLAEGLPAPKRRYTGNPVRPEIIAIGTRSYRSFAENEPIRLFVMGGSQGARIFSSLMPEVLGGFSEGLRRRLRLIQQCRAEDIERVRAEYSRLEITAQLMPFFVEVPRHLENAHLVICRAGASTIAELAAAGRPAILVPLPHSIDDHQAVNARAFAEGGGGWVVMEGSEAPAVLAGHLARLLGAPKELAEAAERALAMGRPDAASILADLVMGLLAPATTGNAREVAA